ncbi:alpha/beta-hydrolase [Aaosphaeria arxii CBS 175.79]|uniref:Alpha/beta-hydrolase n=1 Tax=Aaosphaeria arxii CBS 175.79 TaxID=1450172 RepID=A0A6A5X8D1_9PLEO|nr:alpha/beta-hydrolase [Aaosphaeria arxii CBS 175.79]KAF2009305.1 alpha/beta-hydrolase [Aaosphaeria arxii CBS 175.79]
MPSMIRLCAISVAACAGVLAAASCPGSVSHDGQPAGVFKNVTGIQVYHAYPPSQSGSNIEIITENAILFITDIYGVPLLQNRLLADSLARANYTVIMPDLFRGDAVPVSSPEGPALNLTEWRARHPEHEIDGIIDTIVDYIYDLGVRRLGGVGYCFGGKYVPRFMAINRGIDVGFIAHPSNLLSSEIEAIVGPISIAAGELDGGFNSTLRRNAEDILQKMNSTYQTNLYSGAPHGFAVRVDLNNSRQKYAKEASFQQAVTWFDTWLRRG